MSSETIPRRAFRLLPSPLRERIAGGWANEQASIDRILNEFNSTSAIHLPYAADEDFAKVATGKLNCYYIDKLKNDQINLHLSPLKIIQREDLLDERDIPSLGLNGYIIFNPVATELFQGKALRILPLSIKYRGLQVHLVDLFPQQMGMTLQATGFSDERVFYNSALFLKHGKSGERFVVRFTPPGGMGEY